MHSPEFTKQEHQEFRVITKRKDGRIRVQTFNTLPSRTQQHHADETNPNKLVKKYGAQAFSTPDPSFYKDLSELPSLQEALHTIQTAQNSFAALPSKTRNRLNNDPNELINLLNSTDQKDIETTIELGLRNPKPLPTPEDPQLTAMKEIANNTRKPKKSDD